MEYHDSISWQLYRRDVEILVIWYQISIWLRWTRYKSQISYGFMFRVVWPAAGSGYIIYLYIYILENLF